MGSSFYYGQSRNLSCRKTSHISALKRGKHNNPRMQRVWNKRPEFIFEIVEMVSNESDLDAVEQTYIDRYIGDPNCMNMAICASAPNKGRKNSEETLKKMSESAKKRGIPESTFEKWKASRVNRKLSDSHRSNIGKSHYKPVIAYLPDGGIKTWESVIECAADLNLTKGLISNYCNGYRAQPGSGNKWKQTKHIHGYIFSYIEDQY